MQEANSTARFPCGQIATSINRFPRLSKFGLLILRSNPTSAKSECPENRRHQWKSVRVVPFILFLADEARLGYTSALAVDVAGM